MLTRSKGVKEAKAIAGATFEKRYFIKLASDPCSNQLKGFASAYNSHDPAVRLYSHKLNEPINLQDRAFSLAARVSWSTANGCRLVAGRASRALRWMKKTALRADTQAQGVLIQ
jgi:hypothetical protein